MKFLVTTCFLALSIFSYGLGAHLAKAQNTIPIQINTPDFIFYIQHNPNAITSFSAQDPSQLMGVLHAGDTNVTWDFTTANWSVNPQHPEVDSFMLATGLPLATDSDFVNSDEVVQTKLSPTTSRYHFFAINPNLYAFDLGITEVNNGVARKVIAWNPPIQDAAYPMTFRTTWKYTAKEDGDTLRAGEHLEIASTSVVDGWGNLHLPVRGESAEGALRVREQHIETHSLNGVTESIDTTIVYHYYTQFLNSATIVTDARGMVVSASYTENFDKTAGVAEAAATSELALRISQNPASNSITNVSFTLKKESSAKVELMDLLGRNVRVLQNGVVGAGKHSLSIDPATLASGAYYVRLEAEGKTAMEKLVIAR